MRPVDIQERVDISRVEHDSLILRLKGVWDLHEGLLEYQSIQKEIEREKPKKLVFYTQELHSWDSSLLVFLVHCYELCQKKGVFFEKASLPVGIQQLLTLSQSVPEKKIGHKKEFHRSFVYKVGIIGLSFADSTAEVFTFIGEVARSFMRLVAGKAQFRWSDCAVIMQNVGAEALPIVSLISFLVGLIMAFVGAIQLEPFGASIYVANLVALAMVREMGAMMTGVIMAGRTGAAFAATIGTMKVTEEVDALKTMGISPVDFLVLPRVIALFVMMPLLCIFANYIGIFGGMVVSLLMLDISYTEYVNQTRSAIDLGHASVGVIKSTIFGILIASIGCLRGLQCGNSSSAVGMAATSAVVTGITAIIVADAVFAVLFHAIDF
ncbi:MAG: hypothetical protein AUJ82_05660 [Verrucomicrobia bacterium CG1_02_43_26]|nr:MAG: hypothetical protein AUJ82_05660 [Verrucomicrobia bacterium CG1_02_43_26]